MIVDLERGPTDDGDVSNDKEGWSSSDDLLREIVELTSVPEVEPGDITVKIFAQAAGICKKTARARLDKLVQQGILVTPEGKRREPESNRPVRVWRRAVQE